MFRQNRVGCIFLAILSLLISACGSSSGVGSSSGTSISTNQSKSTIYGVDLGNDLVAYNLTNGNIRWKMLLQTELTTSQGSENHLLIYNNDLYLLANTLTAYQASDGKVLWQIPAGDGEIFAGNNTIYAYIAGQQLLYAINPQNGTLLWRQSLTFSSDRDENPIYAIYHDNAIYIATSSGCAAFNATNGQLLWNADEQLGYFFNYLIWTSHAIIIETLNNFDPNNEQTNTSQNTFANYIFALAPDTGKTLWSASPGKTPDSYVHFSPASAAWGLYSISSTAINSIDIDTGQTEWSTPLATIDGGITDTSITNWVVTKNALAITTGPSGGDVMAFNSSNGKQIWQYQSTDQFSYVASSNNDLYTVGTGVRAFDLATGKQIWFQANVSQGSIPFDIQGYLVLLGSTTASLIPQDYILDDTTGKIEWEPNQNANNPLSSDNISWFYLM